MARREFEELAERRLEAAIARLPDRAARGLRWLRHPDRFWIRVPAGVLIILCGFVGFLPVLGFWMVPLGVVLLAQDVPPLRRAVYRLINWTAERKPAWFGEHSGRAR